MKLSFKSNVILWVLSPVLVVVSACTEKKNMLGEAFISTTRETQSSTSTKDQPPITKSLSISTMQDMAIAALIEASDPEAKALKFTVVTLPVNGTVSLNASNGSFSYTPNTGYFGPDLFGFKVEDVVGNAVSGVVNISVIQKPANPNRLPTSSNSSVAVNEDTVYTGLVTATDLDGDPLTFQIVTFPLHGTLTLMGSGSFTYTPQANYTGADSFQYQVSDGKGVSVPASQVSITVNQVNDAPVAIAAAIGTNKNIAKSGTLNGTDIENNTLTFISVTAPTKGSLVLSATGSYTYTPNLNVTGTDSFTFKVRDNGTPNLDSTPAVVTVTISDTNVPPVAFNQSVSVNEDAVLTGNVVGSDADGDTLTYESMSIPSHGTLVFSSNGQFTYTPFPNYNGSDSFQFAARDSKNAVSVTATVSITIAAINDAPTANAQNISTAKNTAKSGTLTGADIDNDLFDFILVTAPTKGALNLAMNGTFTYTPSANTTGADSFTFKTQDKGTPSLSSTPATVSITITDTNVPPVANAFNFTVNEDGSFTGNLTGSDADGDAINYFMGAAPAHGSIGLSNLGQFTYTPSVNYFGPDSFTFTVKDSKNASSTAATVSITVTGINDAPVALNSSLAVTKNTLKSGVMGTVDVENDTLTYTIVTQPVRGTLSLGVGGNFNYIPQANYTGTDTFTFKVKDNGNPNLESNVATISITITGTNSAPIGNPVSISLVEDSSFSGVVVATDPDGDTGLFFAKVSDPAHGTLQFTSNGNYTYTPAANYFGPDSFQFTARDSSLAISNPTTVSITVTSINDAPVAIQTAPVVVNQGAVANGQLQVTDVDSNVFNFVVQTFPTKGLVNVNSATGAFTYTPDVNASGSDSFVFRVFDNGLPVQSSSAITVSITINAVAPVTKNVRLNWAANKEFLVNTTGGGYKIYYNKASSVNLATATVVNVPYVSGPSSPTTALITGLTSGQYTFVIEAYSGVTLAGSSTNAKSSISDPKTITVP